MCEFTDKGIKFEDGQILPKNFTAEQFSRLNPKNISELASAKASLLSQIEMREAIHNLTGAVQNVVSQIGIMQEGMDKHIKGSTTTQDVQSMINKTGDAILEDVYKVDSKYEKLTFERISRYNKKTFFNFVVFVKATATLIVSGGVISGIVIAISEALK